MVELIFSNILAQLELLFTNTMLDIPTASIVEVDTEGLPTTDITVDSIIPSTIDDHSTFGVEG